MWIRSQDNRLVNLDRVTFVDIMKKGIYANWDNADGYRKLGEYATEERCIEVLNEIQENIETRVVADELMKSMIDTMTDESDKETYKERLRKLSCVYEMPEV